MGRVSLHFPRHLCPLYEQNFCVHVQKSITMSRLNRARSLGFGMLVTLELWQTTLFHLLFKSTLLAATALHMKNHPTSSRNVEIQNSSWKPLKEQESLCPSSHTNYFGWHPRVNNVVLLILFFAQIKFLRQKKGEFEKIFLIWNT